METVVVIRLGRLGDVTLTAPTVKNLRFLYPDSKILFVTRKAYKPLARILPGVDEVLTFPDQGTYFDLVRLSSQIDEYEPSLMVDLHKNFRSFHLANMTRAPYKVVYIKRRKERRAAVNEKKFVSPVPHTIDLYNVVIDQLKGEVFARRPDLKLADEALLGLDAERNGVAIAPGASSPVKAWPTDRFSELAERIIYDFKLPVRLFLGKGEDDLAGFFAHLPEEAVTVYNNHPAVEIATLLSQSRLTITNDSGLMHVSSAVGTPTLAIFGPTHEQLGFYPRGLHDVIVATDEKCRPCSLHGNEPCYREEQYCFTRLTVDTVYGKVGEMLEGITLQPAVFIDRDGCLVEDKHYLADPNQLVFPDGSLDAVKNLKEAGYKIVIVSNQSGVARGFFPVETVEAVHNHMSREMKNAGCEPDDVRFCPYHPDGDDPEFTGDSYDRKPKPGMLEKAAIRHGIDIKRSFMIGDKYIDIQCGKAAGAATILVRTGKGAATEKEIPVHPFLKPDHVCDDLRTVAEVIISRNDTRSAVFRKA
jgi:histidinol-phosphate phosphatase family protein